MKLFEKMEKNEVGGKAIAGSHTGKEVKKRKRCVEQDSIGEAAASTGSADHKQVTDVPLSSPVAEAKLSKTSVDEAVEVQCEDVESFTEDVVAMEAVVDTARENSQSCDIVNATADGVLVVETVADAAAVDAELPSPCGISESCATPNESPTKPTMQASMTDTKFPCMKVDADDVTDQPASTTVRAVEDMGESPEQMPTTELTNLESDTACVDETVAAVEDEPEPATSTVMQADVRTESTDELKKTNIIPETESRVVKGSPKPLSTAKLKFGMYARKPLASRTLVKAYEQEMESSSDSSDADEDTAAKSTSELEAETRPKRGRPVNFV